MRCGGWVVSKAHPISRNEEREATGGWELRASLFGRRRTSCFGPFRLVRDDGRSGRCRCRCSRVDDGGAASHRRLSSTGDDDRVAMHARAETEPDEEEERDTAYHRDDDDLGRVECAGGHLRLLHPTGLVAQLRVRQRAERRRGEIARERREGPSITRDGAARQTEEGTDEEERETRQHGEVWREERGEWRRRRR